MASLLQCRAQPGGLFVEVAYLNGVRAEGVGEQRADGLELRERLVGLAVGGQQLRENEAGLKDLASARRTDTGDVETT